MRCRCCDVELTDYECSIKGVVTNMYLDSCCICLKESGVKYVGNPRLIGEESGSLLEDGEMSEVREQ